MEIIDLSFINKLTILPKMELVGLQRIKAKTDHYCLSKRGSNAGASDCNCDCVCDCPEPDCDCADCVCNDYNCDCPDGDNCYDWDGCSDD